MHDSSRQYFANLKRLKLIHDVGLSNYWLLAKNAIIERQIREQNKFMPMTLVNCALYQQIVNAFEICPKNNHHYYWSVISIHYWLHVIYKVESTIHNVTIICDAWQQVSLVPHPKTTTTQTISREADAKWKQTHHHHATKMREAQANCMLVWSRSCLGKMYELVE